MIALRYHVLTFDGDRVASCRTFGGAGALCAQAPGGHHVVRGGRVLAFSHATRRGQRLELERRNDCGHYGDGAALDREADAAGVALRAGRVAS